jgi:hypothetical protein
MCAARFLSRKSFNPEIPIAIGRFRQKKEKDIF